MREKPRKRLVSRGRYIYLSSKRMSLTFLYKFSFGAAAIVLLGAVVGMYFPFDSFWVNVALILLGSVLSGILGVMGIKFAEKVSKMEDILPITQDNVSRLPLESILVRASDLPPSQQQAELLRAATGSNETPAEELLRATTKTGRGED